MPDTAKALRTASDALLRDLEALAELEDEKRTLPAGDPRTVQLSERIEAIAERVLASTTKQRVITTDLQEDAEAGDTTEASKSINGTPRPIAAILADWRDAERRLAAADVGSVEAREAEILVDSLRSEYAKAHAAARRKLSG